MNKKFWRTSEFWVSVLTSVGAIAGALVGVVSAPVSLTVAAVSTGAYAIARGISKAGKNDP